MTKQIEFELHREDETLLIATHNGVKRTFQIQPSPNGEIFAVTMQDGTTRTVSYRTMLWGRLWHSSGNGCLREFHKSDNRTPETSGDVKAILVVLAWMECRAERYAAGRPCTGYEMLARRASEQTNRIRQMEPTTPSAAATFCTKYQARRIGR